jgi:3-hydroxyisobutyrate dehydrogenase-like beta-hydroxyacid dehydrogenase
MTKEKRTVGLIGLGLMGQALATRLIPAGFRVVGYDIDTAKNAKLKAMGGDAVGSLAEVAKCGVVALAVFSTDQVEEVVEQTLVPAANSGAIVLCTSTCDPDRIAALAGRVAGKGIRFLETPVSGSSGQVSRGEGTGLIGGDPATAADADDILTALYPRRFHIGKAGDAGRAKLAINLILGLNRMALAEGLVFATKLGLDAKAFLDVARASAAYSQVMDIKGRKMIERDFNPEGFVHQSLKDFKLMREQAKRHGQTLPALELNASLLEACVRAGEADYDNSAVIEEIRRRGRSPEQAT